jgi:hypothetical protein
MEDTQVSSLSSLSSLSVSCRLVACAAIVALSTACAGFQGKDALPLVDRATLSRSPATPVRIYSKWSIQTASSLVTEEVKIGVAAIHKDRFDKAILGTGCCTIVEAREGADVVLEGTVYDENDPSVLLGAVLTGASLYTIPSWANIKAHYAAKATAGEKEYAYDLRDSMLMVQWLPLIFLAPFKNPISMEQRMIENIASTLVQRIQNDGLLGTGAATPAAAVSAK